MNSNNKGRLSSHALNLTSLKYKEGRWNYECHTNQKRALRPVQTKILGKKEGEKKKQSITNKDTKKKKKESSIMGNEMKINK